MVRAGIGESSNASHARGFCLPPGYRVGLRCSYHFRWHAPVQRTSTASLEVPETHKLFSAADVRTGSEIERMQTMPGTNHDRFASVFRKRTGRTFSTAEITKLMLSESDIQPGSVLPNDHGEGNKGECLCVGTDRQIFDRVGRGTYRVRDYRLLAQMALDDFRQSLTAAEPLRDFHSPSPDFGGTPRATGSGITNLPSLPVA
jgi:hypothetical protein